MTPGMCTITPFDLLQFPTFFIFLYFLNWFLKFHNKETLKYQNVCSESFEDLAGNHGWIVCGEFQRLFYVEEGFKASKPTSSTMYAQYAKCARTSTHYAQYTQSAEDR